MESEMKSVCIFCGAGNSHNPIYQEKARELGNIIAEKNLLLVYGGASIGLMGNVADGALEKGGKVHGVLPDFLFKKEVGHSGIQNLEIVDSMHTRKKRMYEISDAFIILPGGIGTMDEFFEIFTWSQLELHNKPIGIYNINNYYNKLLNFLESSITDGFLTQDVIQKINVEIDSISLINKLNELINKNRNINLEEKF